MSLEQFISTYFYNDVSVLWVYGLMCLSALLIMATAIYFHELGHWIYFKLKLKKNIKIRFEFTNLFNFKWKAGDQPDYNSLTDNQYSGILLFGVAFGMLPIMLMGYFWLGYLLLLIPYLVGSWGDIKEIFKNEKISENLNEVIENEKKGD
jgi:hypothetical protein